jgi:hypothetical protein
VRRSPPAPPLPPEPINWSAWGERIEQAAEEFGERVEAWGARMEDEWDSEARARINPRRRQWRRGAKWVQNGPEGSGFYTQEELDAAEAAQPEDVRVRKFVKKKMEERTGFLIHLAVYFFVNLMIIGGSLADGDFSIGAFVPAFFWGIGISAHFMDYYNKYGAGRDRREELIAREMERERSRISGTKAKNDQIDGYARASERIRLTEDGELTDSYVDEIEQQEQKRKRN